MPSTVCSILRRAEAPGGFQDRLLEGRQRFQSSLQAARQRRHASPQSLCSHHAARGSRPAIMQPDRDPIPRQSTDTRQSLCSRRFQTSLHAGLHAGRKRLNFSHHATRERLHAGLHDSHYATSRFHASHQASLHAAGHYATRERLHARLNAARLPQASQQKQDIGSMRVSMQQVVEREARPGSMQQERACTPVSMQPVTGQHDRGSMPGTIQQKPEGPHQSP